MHRGAVEIGVLSMRVESDGGLRMLQADPYVEIAEALLQGADPRFITHDDDSVTFHFIDGDVSYDLFDYDDIREIWVGVRSDAIGEAIVEDEE